MTLIHDTPAAAQRRLAELRIPLEPLQRALQAGFVARISCPPNAPPFFPGTLGWGYTVITLRDELCPRSWRKSDPGNFSLVTFDEQKIQIVVESGDDLVCSKLGDPKTKSLKGMYTEAVTARNNIIDDLFPETLTEQLRKAVSILEYPTWIFLVSITDEGRKGELSFPVNWHDKQVTKWKERIFIPDPAIMGGDIRSIEDQNSGSGIDVPVFRKASNG